MIINNKNSQRAHRGIQTRSTRPNSLHTSDYLGEHRYFRKQRFIQPIQNFSLLSTVITRWNDWRSFARFCTSRYQSEGLMKERSRMESGSRRESQVRSDTIEKCTSQVV